MSLSQSPAKRFVMSCVAASAMCAECAVAADGGGAAAATAGVER